MCVLDVGTPPFERQFPLVAATLAAHEQQRPELPTSLDREMSQLIERAWSAGAFSPPRNEYIPPGGC